jgi:uncharacterized ferritin-like protein (DUF455 family)
VSPLQPGDTKTIKGITLRSDPAREACFSVAQDDTGMQDLPGMSVMARRQRLHRHMNNEIGSVEIAAQCLVDFPDTPWELRMHLARQCWDETRHIQLLRRRLEALGGRKGEFPVANFEWSVTCMLDSLAARLAVQNRTFEAGQMDIVGKQVQELRSAGDEETADVIESILADEIQHVRFANQWLRKMAAENKRVLLKVAAAIRFLSHVNEVLSGKQSDSGDGKPVPDINVEDRRLAEFSDAEIQEVLKQAGFRSLDPSGSTVESRP